MFGCQVFVEDMLMEIVNIFFDGVDGLGNGETIVVFGYKGFFYIGEEMLFGGGQSHVLISYLVCYFVGHLFVYICYDVVGIC